MFKNFMQNKIISFHFIAAIIIAALVKDSIAIPAFPGAEGFGADAVGGRYGTVIKVTNLDDSGPGSLRAAIDSAGPRFSMSAGI